MAKKSFLPALVFFLLLISVSYAAVYDPPKPILYGPLFNGIASADGSNVTAYLQSNSSDNVTDIVGPTGKSNSSSYWKADLGNLNKDVQNGEIIVIYATNGVEQTSRTYIVNLAHVIYNISLNYNSSYQDYDSDGSFANADCNDNNAAIRPGATDTCGDGTDQDCSGSDESCPSTTSNSGGGGGGGGGGTTTLVTATPPAPSTPSGSSGGTSGSSAGTASGASETGTPTETPQPEAQPTIPAAAPAQPATAAPTGFAAFTGAAISTLKKPANLLLALIILVVVALGFYYGYYALYKKKKD